MDISVKQSTEVESDLASPIPDEDKCTRCLGYGETGWATTTFYNKKTGKRKRITIFGPAVWWIFNTNELIGMTKKQVDIPVEELQT